MQQALAHMHALTRGAPAAAPPSEPPPSASSKQVPKQKGGPSSDGRTERSIKAAIEGLYALLAALQSVMSSEAYLKVWSGHGRWQ